MWLAQIANKEVEEMRPPVRTVVILALVAVGTVVVLFSGDMAASSGETHNSRPKSELVEVDPQDVVGLEAWAERWCKGWTVPDLAAALRVEATIDAIEDYLSEGLTGEARNAVINACRRELGAP
jgi:hypothetical protein